MLKRLYVILLSGIIIFSNNFYGQEKGDNFTISYSNLTLNDSSKRSNDSIITPNIKDPLKAGLYSAIVPGFALGQLYNGDYLNFVVRLGVTAVCIGVPIALKDSKKLPGIIAVSLLVFSINWVSSIFDASSTAKKINLKNKYKVRER